MRSPTFDVAGGKVSLLRKVSVLLKFLDAVTVSTATTSVELMRFDPVLTNGTSFSLQRREAYSLFGMASR